MNLDRLVQLIKDFGSVNFPMINRIDVSPATLQRLKLLGDPSILNPPSTLLGLQVGDSPNIQDHIVRMHFADGRIGLWDMNTSTVTVIERDKQPLMVPPP